LDPPPPATYPLSLHDALPISAVTHPQNQLTVDLKDFLQHETLSRLLIRIVGNITGTAAGIGAATGRDNPEALFVNLTARHSPALDRKSTRLNSSHVSISYAVF